MAGTREELSMKSSSVAIEAYPAPNEDYLIDVLKKGYAPNDKAGPAGRMKELLTDFRLGVQPQSPQARMLHTRLNSAARATSCRSISTTDLPLPIGKCCWAF